MLDLDINVNSLHSILLRESSNNVIQEIDPNLYQLVSESLGKLKREEYDNVERKIKHTIITITTNLISLLLKTRLDKAVKNNIINYGNLLDEEKFILDAGNEMNDRREMILAGILNGKSKLLESVIVNHKTKLVTVRILQEMDQIVGSDLEKYGPFKTEDVATIPYENAQALITKKIAVKIKWNY